MQIDLGICIFAFCIFASFLLMGRRSGVAALWIISGSVGKFRGSYWKFRGPYCAKSSPYFCSGASFSTWKKS